MLRISTAHQRVFLHTGTAIPLVLLAGLCMLISLCGCQRFYEQQKKYYMEKGRELFNRGEFTEAEKKFQNALVFDERYSDAMYMIAQCNIESGNYRGARKWLGKAAGQSPKDVRIKVKLAEIMNPFIDALEMKRLCEEVLLIEPGNHKALILMISVHTAMGDMDKADKIINELVKEREQDKLFYRVLIFHYTKKRQYTKAAEIFSEHFIFDKKWMQLIDPIIAKLKEDGNNEALIKIYNKMLEQVPDKMPYLEKLSKLYRETKDQSGEASLFQKLIKNYPDVMQFKLDYVEFLLYYKQWSQIKVFLNEQLKEQPGDITLNKALIDYYVQTQQSDHAVEVIRELLAGLPPKTNNYIELQNKLAEIYFNNGDFDMAATIASDIRKQSRRDRDSLFMLAKIALIQGNCATAVGQFRLLIKAAPNSAEYHYYLGLAHEMKDEPVLAEKEFREALTINPNYKDALKNWLAVYPRQGVLTEVVIRIDKYLQSNPEDEDIIALRDAILKKKDGNTTPPDMAHQEQTVALPGLQ
jgi:cellulose synthase operon protein C